MAEVTNTGGGDGSSSSLVPNPAAFALYQATINWEENQSFVFVLIAAGVSVLLLMSCCAYSYRIQTKYKKEQDQKRVFTIFNYLTDFDVDDFDLRRSPTGGFHATYLNGLANGVKSGNKRISMENTDRSTDMFSEPEGEIDEHEAKLSKGI